MTAEHAKSEYEGIGLRAVRPYLIVGDADAAIDFYRRVFQAKELERHTLAAGANGDAPSDRPQGSRAATVYDPFGLTWWLAAASGSGD